MKMRSVTPMKIAKIGYIVMSIVFCIIGAVFIALPEPSLLSVSRMLGVAMIIFGAIKLVGYFSKDLYRLAFQFDLQFGLLMMILGIAMLVRPAKLLSTMMIALGVAIVADALFRIRIAIDAKKFGISAWWLIVIAAVLTAAFGVMVAFHPLESAKALMSMLGIALITQGILNLIVVVFTVKIIKNQYPDVIDVSGDQED